MAQAKTSFSQQMGDAPDPQMANSALLENAGAIRGAAAKLGGEIIANDIATVAKVGDAAYEGYVSSQAEKDAINARDVITGNKQDDGTLETRYATEFGRIKAAADQGVIDQPAATALLGAEMRRLIAAHPGKAEAIRKQYRVATGSSDWDNRLFFEAMTKKQEAQKLTKIQEEERKDVYQGAIAMGLPSSVALQVAQLPPGSAGRNLVEEYVGTTSALKAQKEKVDNMKVINGETSRLATTGLLTEVTIATARVTTQQRLTLQAEVTRLGIDFSKPDQITDAQYGQLLSLQNKFMTEIDTVYANAAVRIDEKAKQYGPAFDAGGALKQLEALRKDSAALFKSFTDRTLFIQGMQEYASMRGQSTKSALERIDTLSKIGKYLEGVAGPDLYKKLVDPDSRQHYMAGAGGKIPWIQDMVAYITAQQAGASREAAEIEKRLGRWQDIFVGQTNPGGATPEQKQAAATATPEELRAVASVTHQESSTLIRAGKEAKTPEEKRLVVASSRIFASHGQELATMRDGVVSGNIFTAAGPENKEAITKNVVTVTDHHLKKGSTFDIDVKNALSRNTASGGGSLKVEVEGNYLFLTDDKGNRITPVTGSNGAIYGNKQAFGVVANANRMFEMRNALGKDITKEMQEWADRQNGVSRGVIRGAEPKTHDGFPARKNADGSISTEVSITVTDPRLNDGKPTNIPSLWGGKELSEDESVTKALESGKTYPSFDTIPKAVDAAKKRSDAGGASAPTTTPRTADEILDNW